MVRLSVLDKGRQRRHSADAVELTVNFPETFGYGDEESPSPSDCNDTKNVSFLAKPLRVVGSENVETANSDDAVVLNMEAPVTEKAVVDLEPFTTQSEPSLVVLEQDDKERLLENQPEKDFVEVIGSIRAETPRSVDAEVLNMEAPVSDESVKGPEPFTSQRGPSVPVIGQDEKKHLREDRYKEVVGSGNTETSNGDDGRVLIMADSVSEESIPELEPFIGRSKSEDNLRSCNSIELASNSSLPIDLAGGGFEATETLPTNGLKQCALESEGLSLADDVSNVVSTKSDEHFTADDFMVNDTESKPQASSVIRSSSDEYLDANMRDVQSVIMAREERLIHANTEMHAMTAEIKDSEVVSEQRDSVGVMEEQDRPRRGRNHVLQLARAYSIRVKEMNASASALRRGQVSASRQKSVDNVLKNDLPSSSASARHLPTRGSDLSSVMSPAGAAESGDSARHFLASRRGSGRSRAKSVDDFAVFPQTNVRETIRRLKQKASSSNISQPSRPSGIFTPSSERSCWPIRKTEDSRQQSFGTAASPRPSLAARQTSTLVQERVRMLFDSGSTD